MLSFSMTVTLPRFQRAFIRVEGSLVCCCDSIDSSFGCLITKKRSYPGVVQVGTHYCLLLQRVQIWSDTELLRCSARKLKATACSESQTYRLSQSYSFNVTRTDQLSFIMQSLYFDYFFT